mgnify:CR=1 FL=1
MYRLRAEILDVEPASLPQATFRGYLLAKIPPPTLDPVLPLLGERFSHVELTGANSARRALHAKQTKLVSAHYTQAHTGQAQRAGGAQASAPSPSLGPLPKRPDNLPGTSTSPQLGRATTRAVDATKIPNWEKWPPGVVKVQQGGVEQIKFRVAPTQCAGCFGDGHQRGDCKYDPVVGKQREFKAHGIDVAPELLSVLVASIDDLFDFNQVEQGIQSVVADVAQTDQLAFNPADTSHAEFLASLDLDVEDMPYVFGNVTRVHLPAALTPIAPLVALAISLGVSTTELSMILDGAASLTMCTHPKMIEDLVMFTKPVTINGAFGSKGKAIGHGQLRYRATDGHEVVVRNVLYAPSLGVNLLSQPALMRAGHMFTNDRRLIVWTDPEGLEVTCCALGKTLILVPACWLPPLATVQALTVAHTGAVIWHNRMGHPGHDRGAKTVGLVDGAEGATGLGQRF